jgi:O-succinylbenzoic acid--CoA ligase
VEWAGGGWTFAEWDRATDRMAASLRESGVRPGETVAAVLRRDADSLALLFAVSRVGGVLAPADPTWGDGEWQRFTSAVAPVAILGDESKAAWVGRAARQRPDLDLTDTHTVVWTSGSAGAPRGVRLSLSNHLASARAVSERLSLTRHDRWLASLPLSHVGGLGIIFRTVWTGACLVLSGDDFDAARLVRCLQMEQVSHLSLVPAMLHMALEAWQDPWPAELRCVLVGGAACPTALLDRALAAGVPVALTYGLTEACSQVATAPPERVRKRPGTVGRPLTGTRLRLTDEGEVLIRGPTVMQGYLNEKTGVSPWLDSWLRTGDLGRLDESGDLWVTGRLGSRIVTGGTNVHPQEVERVLSTHPGIAEAVVLGMPDPVWGEIVTAVVLLREGARPTETELARFCRDELSSPKRPRRWRLVTSLPRTSSGKPDRDALRRLVRDPKDSGDPLEGTC